ncbi:MAG: hypothetical protein WC371_05675, partial [Parachlamydiales bacterium]
MLNCHVFSYNERGLVEKETVFGSDNFSSYALESEYDPGGRLVRKKMPNGFSESFFYNGKGELAKHKKSNGETSFFYDESGGLSQVHFVGVDGKERREKRQYDLQGRLIEEEDSFQNKTMYAYDEFGHLVLKVLPSCLNEEGEEKEILQKSQFDVWDCKILEEDPLGAQKRYVYNGRGQIVKIFYPDGGQEFFLYNLDGTLKSQTDQLGFEKRFFYDSFQRELKKEGLALEGRLEWTEKYSYRGEHLVSSVDKEGREKLFFWDGAGRLEKEKAGDQEVSYAYDVFGRLLAKRVFNFENSYFERFYFDLSGSLIETRAEDLDGRMLRVKKESRSWDFSFLEVDGRIEKTWFDSLGRPVRKEIPASGVAEFQYNENYRNFLGQRVLQVKEKQNGIIVTKTFDALHRLVQIEKEEPFYKKEYLFDAASRKRKKQKRVFGLKEPLIETVFYDYDSMGRLVQKKLCRVFSEKLYQFTYDLKGRLIKTLRPDGAFLEQSYSSLGFLETLKSSDGQIHYAYKYNLLGELLEAEDVRHKQKSLFLRDSCGRVVQEELQNGLRVRFELDLLNRPTLLVLPDLSRVYLEWGALAL